MDDEFGKGDKLVLRGLRFHGFHGVEPEERKLGQKFMVNVDAWLALCAAGMSDNLSDTISYTDIYLIVKEVVEGPPNNLLESVAQLIATTTLSKFSQISAVRVNVGKPHVAVHGPVDYLGVEIFRCRKADSSVTVSKANDDRVSVENHGTDDETVPIAISASKTTKDVGTSEVLPAAKKDQLHQRNQLLFLCLALGFKSLNKGSPFSFSSTHAMSESSSLTVGVHSDSKLEASTSAATAAARMTETTSSASEVDEGNKDKPQDAGNLCRQEDALPSSSSASIAQFFSCGSSMSHSSPNNDSFSSSASQFGSGTSTAAQSNSVSLPSATSIVDSACPVLKAEETSSFCCLNSSSSRATSSSLAGTGNGTFAFGVSAPSSTICTTSADNLFTTTVNATSESLSYTQAASGTGNPLFTESMPVQFGSTTSTQAFGSTGTSPFSSRSSLFSSSSSGANPFGTSSGFGMSSSMMTSTGTSSFSFGSVAASSVSGSSSQSASSSIFSSGFGSATPATGFSFGLSSATAGTAVSAPVQFGSFVSASSGSTFSFTSATSTTTPPLSPAFPSFGLTTPVPTMGTASPGNDQMNMEDSMAKDTVQAPSPLAPVFGQPANTPSPSNFAFGSPAPSGGPQLFQLGSQQNSLTPQIPSPFQAPNSLEFTAGGSFSLGTGGGNKSNRRNRKVSRTRQR